MYVFQKVNMKSLSFIAVVLLLYQLYIAIAIHFVDPSEFSLDLFEKSSSSVMFTSPTQHKHSSYFCAEMWIFYESSVTIIPFRPIEDCLRHSYEPMNPDHELNGPEGIFKCQKIIKSFKSYSSSYYCSHIIPP